MVRDTSGCDLRNISEVTGKAMDVTDTVHNVEGHTQKTKVFWKKGKAKMERKIGMTN